MFADFSAASLTHFVPSELQSKKNLCHSLDHPKLIETVKTILAAIITNQLDVDSPSLWFSSREILSFIKLLRKQSITTVISRSVLHAIRLLAGNSYGNRSYTL